MMEKRKTMLDIMMERLPEGVEVKTVKEKASEFVIDFAYQGDTTKGYLPKTCAPGAQYRESDRTIFNAMHSFALHRKDYEEAQYWTDKILGIGSRG